MNVPDEQTTSRPHRLFRQLDGPPLPREPIGTLAVDVHRRIIAGPLEDLAAKRHGGRFDFGLRRADGILLDLDRRLEIIRRTRAAEQKRRRIMLR
jgi:hypothetical protein